MGERGFRQPQAPYDSRGADFRPRGYQHPITKSGLPHVRCFQYKANLGVYAEIIA